MNEIVKSDGQATVEMVALLPLVFVIGALVWQFVLAGNAVWATHAAARAAARAQAVGGDPEMAARGRLSGRKKSAVKVLVGDDRRVTVRARIPVVAGLPSLGDFRASSYMKRQG